MIYLDNGATSYHKPPQVRHAVMKAMEGSANPGRGGYGEAMTASNYVYRCRETAAEFFHCLPEQVVLTFNCTHGLNIAIRTLVKPGDRVVVSGFEHNAVTRPLYAIGAEICPAGRRLFDWENTLEEFRKEIKNGADAAVFTHVSNVFGYILPVEEMAKICREFSVPFILDAAQSAGSLPIDFEALGASFIAMPGHKGLLGPQGTGLLLSREKGTPLLYGGTGNQSIRKTMPDELPERLEAGTMNTPGAAGLAEAIRYIQRIGMEQIFRREHQCMERCAEKLEKAGMQVFHGPHQAATVSFRAGQDVEEVAAILAKQGISVRAGLHCAPLAHESAGTLDTGTIRVSFGHDASDAQTDGLIHGLSKVTKYTLEIPNGLRAVENKKK